MPDQKQEVQDEDTTKKIKKTRQKNMFWEETLDGPEWFLYWLALLPDGLMAVLW
jgi:hypothetical protein